MAWGSVFISFFICFFILVVVISFVFIFSFLLLELNIRRQKLRRFAPSPEGYYEALLTRNGFIKPADNVPLHVPHVYSPHVLLPPAKGSQEPFPSDDDTVLELFNKGVTLKDIAKATGKTYYQVQKITRGK